MSETLRQATLVFLVKEGEVLLAMKKRGFGKGRWNGVGGKPEEGDTSLEFTAIRECQEEILVTPKSLVKVAVFDFYFPPEKSAKGWDQQVTVYLCDEWEGEPRETDEMAPKFFKQDKVPYDEMWPDDILWLPRILEGEKLQGEFRFDDDDNVASHQLTGLDV